MHVVELVDFDLKYLGTNHTIVSDSLTYFLCELQGRKPLIKMLKLLLERGHANSCAACLVSKLRVRLRWFTKMHLPNEVSLVEGKHACNQNHVVDASKRKLGGDLKSSSTEITHARLIFRVTWNIHLNPKPSRTRKQCMSWRSWTFQGSRAHVSSYPISSTPI